MKFWGVERRADGKIDYLRIFWVVRIKVDNGPDTEDDFMAPGGPKFNINGMPMCNGIDATGHTYGD